MQHRASATGVFLIHGFLGSPREWEALETQLQRLGYQTHAMTHPAHGRNPDRKLCEIGAATILSHCRHEYKAFASRCDRVYVIGHSLGGIAALWLAGQQVEALAGVLAFAAPYEHAYNVNYVHGLLRFEKKHLFRALRYASEFLTGFERPSLSPWWFPLLEKQTTELLSHLQDALPAIDQPVWLAHSPYDMIIPYREMEKIYRQINKPHHVRMHTLHDCGHQFFVQGRQYEDPYHLTLRFLEHLETSRAEEQDAEAPPASA